MLEKALLEKALCVEKFSQFSRVSNVTYLGIMPLSRETFFLRMAIWLRGLECWYLVLGGVAVGRGFEPQSDLELSFAEILIKKLSQMKIVFSTLFT
jgi:hypothetical protein